MRREFLPLGTTQVKTSKCAQQSVEILHSLKSLGVNISIDDFGTGYSSLSYLQTMPIDNLKIDRSFVRNLHQSEKDKAFIQAIVTMAQTLGMKVIAEGVEVKEQFKLLEEIGCDLAQGHILSEPIPKGKLKQLLQDLPHQPEAAISPTPLYCKQGIIHFYYQWLIFVENDNTMKNTMPGKSFKMLEKFET